jgi:DNA-binding MarR family transcriptional regulator
MTPAPETSETRPAPALHLRLRLWVRLLRAVRPIESELRRRLDREFGVTLPKFDVMAALLRHPAGMTMTEVSRELMVSNGNVTGIVDRLVAEELVTRITNAEDRRATFVRLTSKGLKLFEAMAAAHERWVDELLAGFSDERSGAMIGLLDALRAETRTGEPDR